MFGMPPDLQDQTDARTAGAQRAAGLRIEFTGRVLHAEVRNQVVGEDHRMRPDLHFELGVVGAMHLGIVGDVVYTEATRGAAYGLAAALKPGARVRIVSSLTGARMVLPHTESISLLPTEQPSK